LKTDNYSLFDYFDYLFSNKKYDFIIYIFCAFGLALFPYILISLVIFFCNKGIIFNYFGDGSIILLSCGIISNYFTSIVIFRNNDEKLLNLFMNFILIIMYSSAILIYYLCSIESPRSNLFVIVITVLSFFYLIAAIYMAIYDKFIREIKYDDNEKLLFIKYMDKYKKDLTKMDDHHRLKGFKI